MKMEARKLGLVLIALLTAPALAQDAQDQNAPADQEEQTPEQRVAEFEQLLRDTRGLEAYNALLERQIQQQSVNVEQLRSAIEGVPDLERQLPPLLITMVDGLDEFIARDVPFLTAERRDRVAGLYELIEDADASDALKLRRVLEAWLIEGEYGRELLTEQGTVPIDGVERNVDLLILGRIGLIFQTSDDEALTGAWDPRTMSWVPLGSEHRNAISQAIRMARSQIAPDLVTLPVPPPQTD